MKNNTTYSRVKSRNMTKDGVDIVYEVRTLKPAELLESLNGLEDITGVSLIEHEGEFRG